MVIAVVVIAGLLIWAHAQAADRSARLLLVGALALTTAFVVFNKVGSPQYMLWLAPIVVGGTRERMADVAPSGHAHGHHRRGDDGRLPLFYMRLIAGDPRRGDPCSGIRNLLLVVLLGWAVCEIVRVAGHRARSGGACRRRARMPRRR